MSDAPLVDVHQRLRLLGTAHVATSSVEAVQHQIEVYQPDIVAVELCQGRYDTLVSDRRLDKEGLIKSHQRRQGSNGTLAVHAVCRTTKTRH